MGMFKLLYLKAKMVQNVLKYFLHCKIMALNRSEVPAQNLNIKVFLEHL